MIIKRILIVLTLFFSLAIHVNAQEVEQQYEKGRQEFKKKHYRKAADIFSTVINNSSYYYEAYMYRARAYHAMQMEDSALVDFNTSIQKNKKYLTAYYFRGAYFFDLGDFDKAVADFSMVLKTKPKYSKALSYRGQAYEKQGKDDLAMADYSKAIASGTKNYDVYYRRALLYQKQGRLKLAVYDLGKAVKLNPKFQEAYSLRGIIEVQRGRYAESLNDLNKAISSNPEDQQALEARAEAYLKTEQLDKALIDYNRLVSHFHSRNAEVYIQRGQLFVSQGLYTKAQKDFARTLVIDPRNTVACTENAKVYILKGRAQQAVPIAAKAIVFDEQYWDAYYTRGRAYFELKKYSEALKDFNMSIKLHPTADAFYYRGECKAEKGDNLGACEDLHTSEKMGSEMAREKLKDVCH